MEFTVKPAISSVANGTSRRNFLHSADTDITIITTTMKMNDADVPASFTNVALLKCGVTYSINKNLSLDVMTSYGLTTDACDLILEVRLPYTF